MFAWCSQSHRSIITHDKLVDLFYVVGFKQNHRREIVSQQLQVLRYFLFSEFQFQNMNFQVSYVFLLNMNKPKTIGSGGWYIQYRNHELQIGTGSIVFKHPLNHIQSHSMKNIMDILENTPRHIFIVITTNPMHGKCLRGLPPKGISPVENENQRIFQKPNTLTSYSIL